MIRYSLKRFSALYSESSSTFALTWCFHKCYFSNSTLKCDSFFAQLSSLGYTDKSIQDGIRNALSLSFGGAVNDSHLKMLGNEGIHALAKSVGRNMESNSLPKGIVHVVVPHHNHNFDVSMKFGQSIMEFIRDDENGKQLLGEYLECSCGGNMSCSTCHVILDSESYAKCDPPTEAELDMLDLAFEPTETSRLGCQIRMKKELDGLTITIPAGVYNLWK